MVYKISTSNNIVYMRVVLCDIKYKIVTRSTCSTGVY